MIYTFFCKIKKLFYFLDNLGNKEEFNTEDYFNKIDEYEKLKKQNIKISYNQNIDYEEIFLENENLKKRITL